MAARTIEKKLRFRRSLFGIDQTNTETSCSTPRCEPAGTYLPECIPAAVRVYRNMDFLCCSSITKTHLPLPSYCCSSNTPESVKSGTYRLAISDTTREDTRSFWDNFAEISGSAGTGDGDKCREKYCTDRGGFVDKDRSQLLVRIRRADGPGGKRTSSVGIVFETPSTTRGSPSTVYRRQILI